MTTELLFIGDIHLGRHPHRLEPLGLDAAAHSPARAWQLALDHALERGVAAVVLAGDVVDRDRDRFEAYAHLERGARRLAAHGIPLVGVAGNHDHIVLPRLAERVEGFKLLGRGGRWELHRLATEPPVDLLGWSFPARYFAADPLQSETLGPALARRRTEAALIGVLHAHLDAGKSPYAPVSSAELRALEVDAVLLGHLHRPSVPGGDRPIGYLGTLVGLNGDERGWRGPWRVTVAGRGRLAAEPVCLSPLRWEDLSLDVSEIPADDRAPDALHEALARVFADRAAQDVRLSDPALRTVACTVHLVGRSPSPQRLRAAVDELRQQSMIGLPLGDQRWVVTRWVLDLRPALALDGLAAQSHALGLVARLVRDLERGDSPPPAHLLRRAADARDTFARGAWKPRDGEPALPASEELLAAAARRLLEELHGQTEPRP